VAVEMLDPDVAREDVRDVVLEDVELRVRVLADRDEKVGAEAAAVDGPRELARERSVAVGAAGVEQVFLELIEQDEEPDGLRPPSADRARGPRSAATSSRRRSARRRS